MTEQRDIDAQIDHLVYATPNLDDTCADLQRLLGVRASPGGQHLGRGTRNALIALGPSCYLEIVGPDPVQPPPPAPRWFGIDALTSARLVTWAVRASNLGQLVADASARGVQLGGVSAGRRTRSDGVVLEWQLTDPDAMVAGGVVPFLIDWGRTPHPASGAVAGPRLVALRGEHPDSAFVRGVLDAIDVELPVTAGDQPRLIAWLEIDGRTHTLT